MLSITCLIVYIYIYICCCSQLGFLFSPCFFILLRIFCGMIKKKTYRCWYYYYMISKTIYVYITSATPTCRWLVDARFVPFSSLLAIQRLYICMYIVIHRTLDRLLYKPPLQAWISGIPSTDTRKHETANDFAVCLVLYDLQSNSVQPLLTRPYHQDHNHLQSITAYVIYQLLLTLPSRIISYDQPSALCPHYNNNHVWVSLFHRLNCI